MRVFAVLISKCRIPFLCRKSIAETSWEVIARTVGNGKGYFCWMYDLSVPCSSNRRPRKAFSFVWKLKSIWLKKGSPLHITSTYQKDGPLVTPEVCYIIVEVIYYSHLSPCKAIRDSWFSLALPSTQRTDWLADRLDRFSSLLGKPRQSLRFRDAQLFLISLGSSENSFRYWMFTSKVFIKSFNLKPYHDN